MAFNIKTFKGSFTSDLARPSRFDVIINTPPGMLSMSMFAQLPLNLMMRCENAELPSRTLGTVEQKFGSNPSQKFPYHTSYNDLSLTFMLSGDMSEKNFFDSWLEYVNPTTSFDFNYKDKYAAPIRIIQYDMKNEQSYAVTLIKAYPISVNQLDLDWSSEEHHKLTVVFAYDYWQSDNLADISSSLPTAQSQKISDINFSLLDTPIAGGTTTFFAPSPNSPYNKPDVLPTELVVNPV
ncbi:tail tube protein [uncultured Caudovirales phage]|uniref:Tail tube protein n=1 Tax=uncultured Caudovirales phage TaxID=2100421 RepID=A0A6J5LHI8_9CAUD|nr:tail tube protein [uncultured Caudovirales phage]